MMIANMVDCMISMLEEFPLDFIPKPMAVTPATDDLFAEGTSKTIDEMQ